MKRLQIFRLTLTCVLAMGLLAGLSLLVTHARARGITTDVTYLSYDPHVTINAPQANAVLSQTPQIITMTYQCDDSLCFGSFVVEAVSVSVTGEVGPYYAASWVTTTSAGNVYAYPWDLPDEDYTPAVLIARTLSISDHVRTSDAVTVHIDTRAPIVTLTLPIYTENVTFTVAWEGVDGSGQVRYSLEYRRADEIPWTAWFTKTEVTSAIFTVTEQTVAEGHTYYFRIKAYDKFDNASEWLTKSIRVGKQRLYLPLVMRGYPPTWQQDKATAGVTFRTPVGCGPITWYAGTSGTDGVWRSTENARNWSKTFPGLQPDAYPVVANPYTCTQAFVAVWGAGVYHLNGETSTRMGNLDEPFVYGLALKEDTLYAGTNSQGIYKTNLQSVDWQPINIGIDVEDRRIRSLFNISGVLYAGARQCSLYISNDGATWNKQVIPVLSCDDAQVWSIAQVKGVLYAGLGGGKGLYQAIGNVWTKVLAIPGDKTIWGLAYDGQHTLYVSAYDAGVYRCGVNDIGLIQTCTRYDASHGLTTPAVREIYLHNNLLVAGSDDGIWYFPVTP